MQFYTSIPIWENTNRINALNNFRNLVVEYFNNTKPLGYGGFTLSENETAIQLRTEINRILHKMHRIILASSVNPVMQYTPPPAIGGYIRDINLILNIFGLSQFEIRAQMVLDHIDRAIGIYENDRGNSLRRTLNPFFWLGIVFDYVASLPFKLIGKLGFNQEKVESSILGKIAKGIFYIITVCASFLTILNLLGLLERLIAKLKQL